MNNDIAKDAYEQAQKEFLKDELRILENFIYHMPNSYRTYHRNYEIVGDILLRGTSTSGSTSCIQKCKDLGIDPYGYK